MLLKGRKNLRLEWQGHWASADAVALLSFLLRQDWCLSHRCHGRRYIHRHCSKAVSPRRDCHGDLRYRKRQHSPRQLSKLRDWFRAVFRHSCWTDMSIIEVVATIHREIPDITLRNQIEALTKWTRSVTPISTNTASEWREQTLSNDSYPWWQEGKNITARTALTEVKRRKNERMVGRLMARSREGDGEKAGELQLEPTGSQDVLRRRLREAVEAGWAGMMSKLLQGELLNCTAKITIFTILWRTMAYGKS